MAARAQQHGGVRFWWRALLAACAAGGVRFCRVPETHTGDRSGGWDVCLGSRAVRPRRCVGAPTALQENTH